MNAFTIGNSALAVATRGLELTGQNIANASTPGYRRQTLATAARSVGQPIGAGVEVKRFVRADAPSLRTAILTSNSQQAEAEVRLETQRQVETALGDAESSIGTTIESFFNTIEQATSRPADSAVRREIISSANSIARTFNDSAVALDRVQQSVGQQIDADVDSVNRFTKQIADLNGRIYEAEVSGRSANELKDQRDQLVEELSTKIDFRTISTDNGVVNLIARDVTLVVSNVATALESSANSSGDRILTVAGTNQPLRVDGGSLGGLLKTFNSELPSTRERLDALATEFARRVDTAQATGLGLNGPLTSSLGTRSVANPAAPLATQNLPIAPQSGTLTISVTNTSLNSRSNSTIAIDPATQSLNDIAAAITAGTSGQVQASVNPTTNTLEFQAQPGFAFDFAGRPNSPPSNAFDPPTITNSDTAGILAATGVNGLFRGTSAIDFAVRPEFLSNPNLLAASRSGRSGDATNLERLADIRDQVAFGGSRTLNQEFSDIVAQVGSTVSALDDITTAQAGVIRNLNDQEQSIVGVDVNEELLNLLNYQRMVQSASKYLSVVNSALDAILQIAT